MTKLLTAQEARKIASEVQQNNLKNELSTIIKIINESVAAGKMHCSIDKHISNEARSNLEIYGYIVKSTNFRNETCTTISWKEK